ncbi:hypothetical protein K439DRAFT_624928 [Ramaria rubella]|nr:hypothetical protein K439DRAFT_624928 [Ramaria rubella]
MSTKVVFFVQSHDYIILSDAGNVYDAFHGRKGSTLGCITYHTSTQSSSEEEGTAVDDGKDRWPACITLYLKMQPSPHSDDRVAGEMGFSQLKPLVTESQKYAKEIYAMAGNLLFGRGHSVFQSAHGSTPIFSLSSRIPQHMCHLESGVRLNKGRYILKKILLSTGFAAIAYRGVLNSERADNMYTAICVVT